MRQRIQAARRRHQCDDRVVDRVGVIGCDAVTPFTQTRLPNYLALFSPDRFATSCRPAGRSLPGPNRRRVETEASVRLISRHSTRLGFCLIELPWAAVSVMLRVGDRRVDEVVDEGHGLVRVGVRGRINVDLGAGCGVGGHQRRDAVSPAQLLQITCDDVEEVPLR